MVKRDKLVSTVGGDKILDEALTLQAYSKDMSFVNQVTPSCVVQPTRADEVQEIIHLANKSQTPLVPVSSGIPHFRGDTVPSAGGAVIIDLSRMNKVVFVDRPRRVAMVEPGVTFSNLIPKVKKEGLRLNMPFLPRKSKSVVGSILEREPVMMPKYQWDVSDPLACAGLFFGTGAEFRTGQAAGPGNIEEQWEAGGKQKAPYGPGTGSWHRLIQGAQGTMGIVTWLSMRCELLPSIEEPFVVTSSNLNRLLELASWLIRLRNVNECFILNNTNLSAIFAKKISKDYQRLKDSIDQWTLFYTVAGYEYFPEERVSSHISEITELTQRMGVTVGRSAGSISAFEILKTVQRPSKEPYWKLRHKGACQDIFYLTLHNRIEGQLNSMSSLAKNEGHSASDIGVYIQPVVQGTSYHCELNLFYDPEDAKERARVDSMSTLAVKKLMAKGAFFSRPYGDWADVVLNNDAATRKVLRKFKRIFDPNNVMNPGKLCF